MAVIDPIKVIIENYSPNSIESISAPAHPQNPDLGLRNIYFSKEIYIERDDFQEVAPNKKYKKLAIGKEVRLRNSYVIKAHSFDTDFDGNITVVYASYDPKTLGRNPHDGRKINGVIHYVESTRAQRTEFRIFNKLFITENPGKHDNFIDLINKKSCEVFYGFVEESMLQSKKYEAYQFERIGYFCRDDDNDGRLVFNKSVSLKEGF